MFIDATKVKFETLENVFLKLTLEDKVYDKVTLTRLLPYSQEEAYIAVIQNQEEIGIIKDLSELESKEMIKLLNILIINTTYQRSQKSIV